MGERKDMGAELNRSKSFFTPFLQPLDTGVMPRIAAQRGSFRRSCQPVVKVLRAASGDWRRCRRPIVLGLGELVAVPMHREDPLRFLGIFLQFLAQPGDVYIDSAGRGSRFVLPYLVQKRIARKCLATVLDQITEKLEFLGGKSHRPAVAKYLGTAHRDPYCPELIDGSGSAGRSLLTAQQRFYPRQKLDHFERLRDVVVGSDLQSDDLVQSLGRAR